MEWLCSFRPEKSSDLKIIKNYWTRLSVIPRINKAEVVSCGEAVR